jgi:hypothetical protein
MNDDARKRKEKRDREAKRKASERKWTGCIYASKDDEGNDGGALFGMSSGGDDQVFPVMR